MRDKFKLGDFYEDCSYHPCVCVSINEEEIGGISLVDGRGSGCDLYSCGVRKLTLDEVMLWREKGPQGLEESRSLPPDKQWWWPRPLEGLNPGGILEHFFESSLNFLRNSAGNVLGEDIVGWYAASGSFNDAGPGSRAEASYRVKGSMASGLVQIEAIKEGRMWPIQRILLTIEGTDDAIIYEGDPVRGCGMAR